MNDATDSPAIFIRATYRLHSEDVEHFRAMASRMAAKARKRSGCIFMDAAQSVDDPGTFNLMQGWSNRESYDAHVASAEFQSVLHDAMRLRILDHFGALFVVLGEEEIEMPS